MSLLGVDFAFLEPAAVVPEAGASGYSAKAACWNCSARHWPAKCFPPSNFERHVGQLERFGNCLVSNFAMHHINSAS